MCDLNFLFLEFGFLEQTSTDGESQAVHSGIPALGSECLVFYRMVTEKEAD